MSRPLRRHYSDSGVEVDTPSRSLYSDLLAMSPPANLGEESTVEISTPPVHLQSAMNTSEVDHPTEIHDGPSSLYESTNVGATSTAPPTDAAAQQSSSGYVPPRRFGSANSSRQRRIPVDVQEVMCRETIRYDQSHQFVQLRKMFLQGYFAVMDDEEQRAEVEAHEAARAHESRVAAAAVHLAVGTDVLEQMMSAFLGEQGQVPAASRRREETKSPLPIQSEDPSRWSAASPFYQPPVDEFGDTRNTAVPQLRQADVGDGGALANEAIFATIPQDFALEFLSSVPVMAIHNVEARRYHCSKTGQMAAAEEVEGNSPRRLSRRESAAAILAADTDGEIAEVVFVRGGKKHHRKKATQKKRQEHPRESFTNVAAMDLESSTASCQLQDEKLIGGTTAQASSQTDFSPLRRTTTSPGFVNGPEQQQPGDHGTVLVSPLSSASTEETPTRINAPRPPQPPVVSCQQPPLPNSMSQPREGEAFLKTLRTTESLTPQESLAQQEAMLMYRLEELQLSDKRRTKELQQKSLKESILRSVPFQRPDSGDSRRDVHEKVLRCLIAFEQLERRALHQSQEQARELIEHRYDIEARASPLRESLTPQRARVLQVSPPSTDSVEFSPTIGSKTPSQTTRVVSPHVVVSPKEQSHDQIVEALRRQLSPEDPETERLLHQLEQHLAVWKDEETQRQLLRTREQLTFQRTVMEPFEAFLARQQSMLREHRLALASEKLARYVQHTTNEEVDDDCLKQRHIANSRELTTARAQVELMSLEADARAALVDLASREAQRLEVAHWTGYTLRGEYDWGRGVFRSTRPRWASRGANEDNDDPSSGNRRPSPTVPMPLAARPPSTGMQARYFNALPASSRGLVATPSRETRPIVAAAPLSPPPSSNHDSVATAAFLRGGLHALPLRPETPSYALLLPQIHNATSKYGVVAASPVPPPHVSALTASPSLFTPLPFRRQHTSAQAHGGNTHKLLDAMLRLVRLEMQCREELLQQYYRQAPLGVGIAKAKDGSSSSTSPRRQLPMTNREPTAVREYPTPRSAAMHQPSLLAQTAAHYFPMSSTHHAQRLLLTVPGGGLTSTGSYSFGTVTPITGGRGSAGGGM